MRLNPAHPRRGRQPRLAPSTSPAGASPLGAPPPSASLPSSVETPSAEPHGATPADRLLLAALDEIEASGLHRATVRAIVKRAGMNVASVNYHFGSKEELVQAALGRSLANMWEDVTRLLDRAPEDPQASLEQLATFLLEGAQRYPNITRAHVVPLLTDDDERGPFAARFHAMIARLEQELRTARRGLPKDSLERRVRSFLAAIFFTALFPRLVDPARSLHKPLARTAFARELATQLLSPERA